MANDWRAVSLGELFRVKHGFAFKSEYFTDEPQDTVLVTPGNFAIGGGFQDGKRKYYNGQLPEDYVLKPGQVVVTMTDLSKESDTLGYAASIPNDSTVWLHNQRVGLLEFKTEIPTSPRFIEYLLRTHEYRSWIVGSATGTTVKHTAPGRIENFATRIPPIEEQHAIAHILGTLDDKIELNRRSNETLEAMARALFKAWFVDFEPVRAKMEGRWQRGQSLPGLPAHLYDIFPDRIVESELGEIPEGWCVEELSAHLDVLETGRRPKGGVGGINEGVPSVGAESIIGVGKFEFGKTKYVSEEFFASMKSGHAEPMDVMLYKDGGKPGDFRPRVSMFGRGFPFDRYAINEHVFRMRSKSLGQVFLYLQVSHERILFDLRNRGGKAAIPGINQSDVKTLLLVVPRPDVLAAFDKAVFPMMEGILERAVEGRSLAQLRDTLLPKLISGELRVPDAERIVGVAV